MRLRLQNGVRIENVDGETIVLDSAGSLVHRVTGEAVEALRLAEQGINDSELPAHLSLAMASLVDAGVVGPAGWSRRKLLAAGVVGVAAATVTSFALASPAAAASCPGGGADVSGKTFAATGTFKPGPGITSVTIHAWGGGGSGGKRKDTAMDSAGGGGGAYASSMVTVVACTSYAITVTLGLGGAEPSLGSDGAGNNGTATTGVFGTAPTVTVTAAGGTAGNNMTGGAGGTTAASTGTVKTAGGAGFLSNPGAGGGGGGAGGSAAGGSAGTASAGGAGGGTSPTNGGNGGTPDDTSAGRTGKSPGGGAAGRDNTNQLNANGADGLVMVTVP